MTLANLVHGLRTEGTGCSLAPLYRSSYCRRGRPIVSEGILMRRGTMLMVGLLLASTAMPQTADARPLLLKMLRGMTAPLGVFGGGRHYSRRAVHHRRAIAPRTRAPAVAAVPAAAGAAAAAATAATAAATTGSAPGTASDA